MPSVEVLLAQHPLAQVALVFILSAIANWLVRTSTPDEWEKLKREHPRAAACISLLRGLGVDPVKAVRALQTLFTGRWGGPPDPPDPPKRSMPPVVLRAISCLAIAFTASACNTVSFRAVARGTVHTMAHAVKIADKICADSIHKHLAGDHTPAVAETCIASYKTARNTLMVAESAIDAIDHASNNMAVCAMAASVDALLSMRNAVKQFAAPPKELEDALELAQWAVSIAGTNCAEAK